MGNQIKTKQFCFEPIATKGKCYLHSAGVWCQWCLCVQWCLCAKTVLLSLCTMVSLLWCLWCLSVGCQSVEGGELLDTNATVLEPLICEFVEERREMYLQLQNVYRVQLQPRPGGTLVHGTWYTLVHHATVPGW